MAIRSDPEWWVIVYESVTGTAFQYYEGTQAGAEKIASTAVAPAENPITGSEGNLSGPYTTEAQAKAAVSSGQVSKPSENIPNPLTGINAVGDFFNRLTDANTWIRVGEVGVGLVLLYVGLKEAFPGAVEAATAPAKKAAKAASLLGAL